MAKFAQVGQIVALGTPIEETVEAVNIGGNRYKLPDGKEKIYAGSDIVVSKVQTRAASSGYNVGSPTDPIKPPKKVKPGIIYDIDYSNGRFSVTGYKDPTIIVTYKRRPYNSLANIYDYSFRTERTSRDIQTIDMKEGIEDLGTSMISGKVSAYVSYEKEKDIIEEYFEEGKPLELEFFVATKDTYETGKGKEFKTSPIKAVFTSLDFSHQADEKVTLTAEFKGYRS